MIIRLTEVRDAEGVQTHQMCCYCFRYVPVDELWVDETGQKWDSCGPTERDCPQDWGPAA